MPIDEKWIKVHVKAGRIAPVDGVTCMNPRWPHPHMVRKLWRGTIEKSVVEFYPAGRVIDMSTVRVRSATH